MLIVIAFRVAASTHRKYGIQNSVLSSLSGNSCLERCWTRRSDAALVERAIRQVAASRLSQSLRPTRVRDSFKGASEQVWNVPSAVV